jgi:hypothetical protein
MTANAASWWPPALPDISRVSARHFRLRLLIALLLLIEGHADPLFLAPDHAAGQMISIRHQGELRGDSERAADIQGRAGGGDIAYRAIDRAAAELDRSGLQHTMSGCNPVLVHRSEIYQNRGNR